MLAEKIVEKVQQCGRARIVYRLIENKQSKRVIVMVHGLASNMTRWTEFMRHTRLNKEWNLLAIDLRGHGRSPFRGRYNREQWCKDIHAIVQAEQYDEVVILGHSMGAQVAMHYALQYGQEARALILIDPVFDQNLVGRLATARRYKLFLRFFLFLIWAINLLGFKKRKFVLRDLYELDRDTRSFLEANPDKGIAELYMSPFEDLKYMPLANYLQDLLEVVSPVGMLENIACPVLVLLSKGASMSDVEKNSRIINSMPRSEIETIEADHWLLTERPAEARRAIEAWCDRLC